VAESCTNASIDPGERVTVTVGLRNLGTANTTNLVVSLQSSSGINSPSASQTYGVLTANGAAVTRSFSFTAIGTCGATNTATFVLQDGATSLGSLTFRFPLGQTVSTPIFSENFDGVTPPALPAGWTTTASGAESVFVTTTAAHDTVPNSVFVPDPTAIGLSELDSPTIVLPNASCQLSFRHSYSLESTWDGGVLEIKIGAGSWTDVVTAGGSFNSGSYSGTLNAGSGNSLANRQAWTGDSSGFITTVANLPAAAAGHSIQLRWLCGSDQSVGYTGWYVDSVHINSVVPVCCATAPVFTSVTRSGATLTMVWASIPGRTYQVQYTTSANPASWNLLATVPAAGPTSSTTDTINAGPRRFYRVVLLP